MLSNIAQNLAKRFRNENDLSDATWVVAKSCPEFLNRFMEMFNFKDFDREKATEIYREYREGGNQVDFLVQNAENRYIIENKIGDTDYHIKEYTAFSVKGRGIIINHEMEEQAKSKANENDYAICKWDDFVKSIQESKFKEGDSNLIDIYIQYVKEVCAMKEIKEIRFDKLISLSYFSCLVEKIIQKFNREDYNCAVYSAPNRECNEFCTGKYFTLKKGAKELCPWFGIFYDTECIAFAFEPDWCKLILQKYHGKPVKKKMFDIKPEKEQILFVLNPEKMQEFSNAPLYQQENILKDFFNSMVDEISLCLDS